MSMSQRATQVSCPSPWPAHTVQSPFGGWDNLSVGLVGGWQTRMPSLHAICSKGVFCVSESGGSEFKTVLVHAGVDSQPVDPQKVPAGAGRVQGTRACRSTVVEQVIQLWALGRRQIARIAEEERNRRVLSTAMAKLQAVVESQRVAAP